jgi:hypothetical protein
MGRSGGAGPRVGQLGGVGGMGRFGVCLSVKVAVCFAAAVIPPSNLNG